VHVTAVLKYQTFNREYMEFIKDGDREQTMGHGGRARNIPAGPYENVSTWGNVTYQLWQENENGKAVELVSASKALAIE